MNPDTQSDRRAPERRNDGVTSKILHAVFAMRRGFGSAAAKNLLLRNGHEAAFIEQVLALPGERRGQGRRDDADSNAPLAGATAPSEAPVTLDADGMAVLHRLRFEADSGMHRMTLADCPPELARLGLLQLDRDGTPTITAKGRQALRHFACVRALDSLARGTDAIPMSEDIRAWLETNLFLQRAISGDAVTALGQQWLAFNATLAEGRSAS